MRAALRRALAGALTVALAAGCTTSGDSDVVGEPAGTSPPSADAPAASSDAATATSAPPDTTPAAARTAVLRDADGTAFNAALDIVAMPDLALPEGVVAAGAAVEVRVADGAVTAAAILELPGAEPPAGSIPVVAHLNDVGNWELDPARYAEGLYVADVASFSIRVPAWLNPAEWFDGAIDWLTGRTDPPTDCDPDPYGWVLAGASPVDGSFHACARANPTDSGAERVEVKIKSNRAMAMWITIPDHPYDYMWVEHYDDDWDSVAAAITALDSPGAQHRVLLPPGRTMTLGYTRPADGGPRLDFSSYQNNTTQIVSLLQKYLGDLGVLGTVLTMVWCVADQVASTGSDVRFGELALDVAVGCVKRLLDHILEIGAAVFDQAYASIVRHGRVQLSTGATDGIERLIGNADKLRRIGDQLAAVAHGITAARMLVDVASMLQDSALATMPGLNLYTVFFVGAGPGFDLPAVCGLRATRWTTGEHPDSAEPGPWASGTTVTGDADGDGRDDTVWATVCGAGTVAAGRDVHVFDADRRLVGTLPVADVVGVVYGDVQVHALDPTVDAGTVTAQVWVWASADDACCPSIAFALTFAVTDTGFELLTPVPPEAFTEPPSGEAPVVAWDGVWREKTGPGRVVQLGNVGEQVRWLQEALVLRDYDVDVDGYFGEGTEQAVRQFQRDRGLTVNGIATEEVWNNFGE